MLKNNFLLFILIVPLLTIAQIKKTQRDTIYIYEDELVHDTIFIKKTDSLRILNDVNSQKTDLLLHKKNKVIKLPVKNIEIKNQNDWTIQLCLHSGINQSSLLKEYGGENEYKTGLNCTIKKSLFKKLQLGIGVTMYYVWNPFEINSETNKSSLEGYYFDNSNYPMMFDNFKENHISYKFPIQLYYQATNYLNFSVGTLFGRDQYSLFFKKTTQNSNPPLNAKIEFNTQKINLAYLIEVEYKINKKWALGIHSNFLENDKTIFTNNVSSTDKFILDKKNIEINYYLLLRYRLF
ncbi:MAG: hypothetical protein QM535_11350 [Limnohabitans sp.]|nr:hypothetical protein [Limnohabitans sp.]